MADMKLKLLRILEILQQTDEDHPLTAVQIGEKLSFYGIKAERKSICRDINVLKDDAGYDIALCEDNRRGYYMVSREFEDWELKVLTDAVWGAKFLTNENAKLLTDKLMKLTSTGSRSLLKAASPVKNLVKSHNVSTKINIDLILRAIKANRKIRFHYTYTDVKMDRQLRKDGMIYPVNPYALIWREEHYYLVGNYDRYDDLSCYRLDRIKSLCISEEIRKPLQEVLGANADLRLEEYVRSALYRYGGKEIKLTLQVNDYMVDDLIDYFGSEIQFVPFGEAYRVTVDVMESDGLYYWLLQYMNNVKVITPQAVRDQLVQRAKAIVKLYDEKPETDV